MLARDSVHKGKLLTVNNSNGTSIDSPLIWTLNGLCRGPEGRIRWLERLQ